MTRRGWLGAVLAALGIRKVPQPAIPDEFFVTTPMDVYAEFNRVEDEE